MERNPTFLSHPLEIHQQDPRLSKRPGEASGRRPVAKELVDVAYSQIFWIFLAAIARLGAILPGDIVHVNQEGQRNSDGPFIITASRTTTSNSLFQLDEISPVYNGAAVAHS